MIREHREKSQNSQISPVKETQTVSALGDNCLLSQCRDGHGYKLTEKIHLMGLL